MARAICAAMDRRGDATQSRRGGVAGPRAACGASFVVGVEDIADTARRVDQLARERVVDPGSQAPHGDVDHFGVAVETHVPDVLGDQRARDRLGRMACEVVEQREVLGHEVDADAGTLHAAAHRVDFQVGDAHDAVARCLRGAACHVALAVLATLGAAAHAQSTVTLFGVADAVVQIGRSSGSNQTGLDGPVATRVDNSLTYFTPNFGGFYGALQAYRGEQAAGAGRDNGNGYGVRLGSRAGPLDIGVSYGTTDDASGTTAATAIQGDIDDWSVGASYNLGVATIMDAYRRAEVDNAAFGDPEGQGYIVGARVPLGAGEIRTSWSRYEREYAGVDAKADKFAVGYVHNLPKRTALYTTFAYLKNKGGAGVTLNGATLSNGNDSSKGLDIGLRHAF